MNKIILLLLTISINTQTFAHPCAHWSPHRSLDQLDPRIAESSGIEVSSVSDDLYHINDSGDGPRVYVTDSHGQNMRTVEIENFKNMDTEDLSVASCPSGKASCLYIADTGDNKRIRPFVQIAILKETELWKEEKARPSNVLAVTYPEGPQDAESMAVHPNGDLFIVTKSFGMSRIYKISKNELKKSETQAELVGIIDLRILGPMFYLSLATGMDISPDGTSFLLMTYNDVIEFPVDLSRLNDPVQVIGFEGHALGLLPLKQQEAIAYINTSQFIYTTEGKSPLKRFSCDR